MTHPPAVNPFPDQPHAAAPSRAGKFSVGTVIGAAWRALWRSPLAFICWTLVAMLVGLPSALTTGPNGEPTAWAQQMPALAASLEALTAVLGLVIGAFLVRGVLRALDGERVRLGDFVGFRHFAAYLLSAILVVVLMVVAAVVVAVLSAVTPWALLLVIPVVLLLLLFVFVPYAALDRGRAGKALGDSAAVAVGNVGGVLLLALLSLGLLLLSVITLFVGLLVIYPFLTLLWAAAWRQATGGPLRA